MRNLHQLDLLAGQRSQKEFAALEGVIAILPHIAPHADLLEKIWVKVQLMDERHDGGIRGFLLYPALAKCYPERRPQLLDRLRRTLVSDDPDDVRLAIRTIHIWFFDAGAAQTPVPDLDDLIRKIGTGISVRRLALLRPGLDFARSVFRDGPEHLRALIAQNCEHGLSALLLEASYDRTDQPFDVPAIRAACFKLALAMAASGRQSRAVSEWLAAANADPLPEVRYAEDRRQ